MGGPENAVQRCSLSNLTKLILGSAMKNGIRKTNQKSRCAKLVENRVESNLYLMLNVFL